MAQNEFGDQTLIFLISALQGDSRKLEFDLSPFDWSVFELFLDLLARSIILHGVQGAPAMKLEELFKAIIEVDVQIEAPQDILVDILFDIYFDACRWFHCDSILALKLVEIYTTRCSWSLSSKIKQFPISQKRARHHSLIWNWQIKWRSSVVDLLPWVVDLDALGVDIHGIYTNQLVWLIFPSSFYVFQLVCDLDETKIQLNCSQ